jgi:microcystin-dependent protein
MISGTLSGIEVESTGGRQPFSILPPFTVINQIIAVEGLFPSRQ